MVHIPERINEKWEGATGKKIYPMSGEATIQFKRWVFDQMRQLQRGREQNRTE